MLPQSHVAYTWLALSLAQDKLDVAPDADYPGRAGGNGPRLIDKPLAWAHFYKRYRSAVLFAHAARPPRRSRLTVTHFRDSASMPLPSAISSSTASGSIPPPSIGPRLALSSGASGSEQEIGKAYWIAFTRRPELWTWELGGLLALAWFVWRHRLYRPRRMLDFLLTGKPRRQGE